MPPVSKFINEIHNNKIGDLKTLTIREHRFPFLKKVMIGIVLKKILVVHLLKNAAISLI